MSAAVFPGAAISAAQSARKRAAASALSGPSPDCTTNPGPLPPLPSRVGIVSSCIAASNTRMSIMPTTRFGPNLKTEVYLLAADNNPTTQVGTKLFSTGREENMKWWHKYWSFQLRDSNDNRVLRMHSRGWQSVERWFFSVPHGTGYRGVGSEHGTILMTTSMWDFNMRNTAGVGEPITMSIRVQNSANRLFNVAVNGVIAARVKRTNDAFYPECPS